MIIFIYTKETRHTEIRNLAWGHRGSGQRRPPVPGCPWEHSTALLLLQESNSFPAGREGAHLCCQLCPLDYATPGPLIVLVC